MSLLVQKGDTIYVSKDRMTHHSNNIEIEWQQDLSRKTQRYLVCYYVVKSGDDNSEQLLYVQNAKADDFFAKKTDGEDFTFTVDGDFQYGTNKENTKRFLVFHDKKNKPYQHRLIESTTRELGEKCPEVVEALGYTKGQSLNDLARNFTPEYLHTF